MISPRQTREAAANNGNCIQTRFHKDGIKAMGITKKKCTTYVPDDQPLTENLGFRGFLDYFEPMYRLSGCKYIFFQVWQTVKKIIEKKKSSVVLFFVCSQKNGINITFTYGKQYTAVIKMNITYIIISLLSDWHSVSADAQSSHIGTDIRKEKNCI